MTGEFEVSLDGQAATWDSSRVQELTSRGDEIKLSHPIIFGSCNRQNLPQDHWSWITSYISTKPEAWVWTGDAVYARNSSMSGLDAAYAQLLGPPPPDDVDATKWVPRRELWPSQHSPYLQFLQTTIAGRADGIWDDHDYGINDAGSLPDGASRARRYSDFINTVPIGDPSVLTTEQPEVEWSSAQPIDHEGLYHTRDFDHSSTGGGFLRMIFLDTRYAREDHYIPSVGHYRFPLSAMLAALIRTMSVTIGLGFTHSAKVLSEKQWSWLETTLRLPSQAGQPKPDYTVIVSSIQVFTSNPAVESWGHYPVEKARLVELLRQVDPPNLAFLSGDVHHGESITIPVVRALEDDEDDEAATSESHSHSRSRSDTATPSKTYVQDYWSEITSSGLTHTCADGILNRLLCPLMLNTFSRHRRDKGEDRPLGRDWWVGDSVGVAVGNSESTTDLDNLYSYNWEPAHNANKDGYYIGRNVGSIVFDANSMNITVHDVQSGEARLTKVIGTGSHLGAERYPIRDISVPDFFRFPRDGNPKLIIASLLISQAVITAMLVILYMKALRPVVKWLWGHYKNTIFYSEAIFGRLETPEEVLERKKHQIKARMKAVRWKAEEEARTGGLSDAEIKAAGKSAAEDFLSGKRTENESTAVDEDEDGDGDGDGGSGVIDPQLVADIEVSSDSDDSDEDLASTHDRKSTKAAFAKAAEAVGITPQSRDKDFDNLGTYDKNSIYKPTADGGLMQVTGVPNRDGKTMNIHYKYMPAIAKPAVPPQAPIETDCESESEEDVSAKDD